jgi:hypothetical protein
MATETRTIVFDGTELMQAAYAYCLRKGVDLPRARLQRVVADPETTGVVRLIFEAPDASQTEITLSYSQMAAALIMHCGVIGVPLPRFSRKRLTPAGEGMALIVRLPEYAGEAEDAPVAIANTASAGKGIDAIVSHVYAPTGRA